MLIDELHLNRNNAKQLLQKYSSVKKAMNAYKTK